MWRSGAPGGRGGRQQVCRGSQCSAPAWMAVRPHARCSAPPCPRCGHSGDTPPRVAWTGGRRDPLPGPEAATLGLWRHGDSRGVPAKVAGHSSRVSREHRSWPLPISGHLPAGQHGEVPRGLVSPGTWQRTAVRHAVPHRCFLSPLPLTHGAGDLVPSSSHSCIQSSSSPTLCLLRGRDCEWEEEAGELRWPDPSPCQCVKVTAKECPRGRTDGTAGAGPRQNHRAAGAAQAARRASAWCLRC